MIITRRYELDMGHMLPEHGGKCYRPHGHRYAVEATVRGFVQSEGVEQGMVVDFATLHGYLADIIGHYDHRFVVADFDPRCDGLVDLCNFERPGGEGVIVIPRAPTAENLADWWANDLTEHYPDIDLRTLRVYETPNCWADWTNPDP